MNTVIDIASVLRDAGIKPSAQRIAILGRLAERRVHPTIDELYRSLADSHPTLSRTTVYNTMSLLVDHGLVTRLEGDSGGARYDYSEECHGHFYCERCGTIIDIPMPEHFLRAAPEGVAVTEVSLSVRGYCRECRRATCE